MHTLLYILSKYLIIRPMSLFMSTGTLCPKLDIVQTSGNGTKCVIHTVPSSGGNGPAAHLLWHKTGSKKKQSTSGL